MQRDMTLVRTARAEEYMTSDQERALQDGWDTQEYVAREAINAPDWALYVDRDGTAYSVEALAEEWLRAGGDEYEAGIREAMLFLSQETAVRSIMSAIEGRLVAGELREVVDHEC